MANMNKKHIDANNARMNAQMIQVGIVKDNRDPKKMGRLKVWVNGSSSLQDNKTGWITCSYASPFAGNVKGSPNADSYSTHPKSYGFWAVPPDVGTRVFVFFVNGKQEEAYWFGFLYDYGMNAMVPAPAAQRIKTSDVDADYPVIEYDKNTPGSDPQAHYINSPLLAGLEKQKLLYDKTKGAINRSSRRQAPAQVYGMSTPRGNHFVIDDGYTDAELNPKYWDDDPDNIQNTEYNNPANDTVQGARKSEGIVLRTRSGAQIIISESDGFVYIINRDGTAHIEMTSEGDVEVYGSRDIHFRAGRDITFQSGRDIRNDVGRNFKLYVNGVSNQEYIGEHHSTYHANALFNGDADIRHYAKGKLLVKGDGSLHLDSPAETNVSSGSTLSLNGASAINSTGGGGNTTLKGDFNASGSILSAGDVKSASASLSAHTHNNVQGGKDMTPPPVSGSGGGASASGAAEAEKASDQATVRHEVKQVDDAASVSAGKQISKKQAKDINVPQTTGLSAMSAVMPATGTIDNAGYWGKDVMQPKGFKADNPGWLIVGSGTVASMYQGYVVNRTANSVQINHRNGFQSMYKGITVDDAIQDGTPVTAGQKIGSYKSNFLFEVRGIGSPLFGFAGTVDPGRFFIEETGIGKDCAGKSLTLNKKTNTSTQVITTADGGSELVSRSKVNTVLDRIVLSGSLHTPNSKAISETQWRNARDQRGIENDPTFKGVPTPIGWVVEPSDTNLQEKIKNDEGTYAYQQSKGLARNGRFHYFLDISNNGDYCIGYGHNFPPSLRSRYANGLSIAEAELLLQQDLVHHVNEAKKLYARYQLQVPREVQQIMVEMVYQMGSGSAAGFVKFFTALKNNNYRTAAAELQNSNWYSQTPERVQGHINILLSQA